MSGTVLVLGAGGQVGRALQPALAALVGSGSLGSIVALDRSGADLTNEAALRAVVRRHRPAVIVNAAAYTAVDRAEHEAELALAVNGAAPGVLAEEAEAMGALLVHYSTDYVFDGTKRDAYVESDGVNPLSVYGASKREGESAVARACARHVILRTSWVHAPAGTNFARTMLRLAQEREQLRVVADQWGAPTSATLVARVTAEVVGSLLTAADDDARWGLYHVTAAGATTWHAYAQRVLAAAARAGVALRCAPEGVVPIPTAEYPVPAARPLNSRLDTSKLRATFGITLPPWEEDVDALLADLTQQQPATQ